MLAKAQNVASVTGVITDNTGAAVPGASVKLTNTRTGTNYFGRTAGDGGYRILDVPPGPSYTLTVTKEGFQTFVVANLYLPVAAATTQNAQLKVGELNQTVEVTSQGAVTLNTTSATIGNNLDMRAVADLPNEFRDDPGQLLRLQAGVVSAQTPQGMSSPSLDPNGTRDGSIAGARADQNNIIVDGIEATNFTAGAAFVTEAAIPVDAIQEFNTLVADPTPAYGGRSGAQTIITTKSGTNEFHGSAYEFNRTAATEANSYFNNLADVPRPALIRNQFGANIGGPVLKDKLFFFFEFDGRRDRSASSVERTVPMPHVDNGEIAYVNNSEDFPDPTTPGQIDSGCEGARLTSADVSTSCITILPASEVQALDPCSTTDCSGTPGFTAPGFDPALLSLFQNRYPAPNDYSGGDGINTAGYRFNAPTPLTENQYVTRVDYNINSNNKLFVRFNLQNETGINNLVQFPTDPLTSPEVIRDRAWAIGETWTINANTINQFTYGETREDVGDPILFNPGANLYLLTFFSGVVDNPYVRQSATAVTIPYPTFRDDLTWIHGKHTLTVGAEWDPIETRDVLTNDFVFIQQGIGGNLPSLPSTARPSDISGASFAQTNFDGFDAGALGLIWNSQTAIDYEHSGTPESLGTPARRDWRVQELAGYIQDSWRVLNDLTLTGGVRYQYQTVPYETNGVEAQFLNTNVNNLVQTRVQNGLNGVSGPDATPLLTYQLNGKVNNGPPLYNPEKTDFSPRLGLAWNPSFTDGPLSHIFGDRKTVIRAGGALIFDQTVVDSIIHLENQSNYLFGNTVAEQFGSSGNPMVTEPRLNALDSVPYTVTPPPFANPLTPTAIFNYGVDNQLKTPYSITASLGFQRELPGGFQLESDYYGRFGRRLFVLADAAQAIDFTDPTSGQKMSQAFTALEVAAQQGAMTVPNEPWFENQIGPGGTALVYDNFGPPGNDPDLALGNTGGIAYTLSQFGLLAPNVGYTPQFAVNALGTNKGFSSYNGLLTTLRKRFSQGLQFDFNYTYSHSIDNSSITADQNGNFQPGVTTILCDVTDNRACRGNSEFDVTHSISADFIYDLPFGSGQRFGSGSGRLLNEAIGGWTVSGIETWHSGLAFTADNGLASTLSLAADPGEVFTGPRSALASDLHFDPTTQTVQFYKDPSAAIAAFTPATGLNVGTRDNLRGPDFSNLDVSVLKNFPLASERYKLQFRADAYNVFNHPNFGLPSPTLTSPTTFGTLSDLAGEEAARVMQFALQFSF